MTYLILLVLGLLIGAVFLVVLLIGDRKEARLEAQRKMLQEQTMPPPPLSQPTPSPRTGATRAANHKMVRTFFPARNYALGTTV